MVADQRTFGAPPARAHGREAVQVPVPRLHLRGFPVGASDDAQADPYKTA